MLQLTFFLCQLFVYFFVSWMFIFSSADCLLLSADCLFLSADCLQFEFSRQKSCFSHRLFGHNSFFNAVLFTFVSWLFTFLSADCLLFRQLIVYFCQLIVYNLNFRAKNLVFPWLFCQYRCFNTLIVNKKNSIFCHFSTFSTFLNFWSFFFFFQIFNFRFVKVFQGFAIFSNWTFYWDILFGQLFGLQWLHSTRCSSYASTWNQKKKKKA